MPLHQEKASNKPAVGAAALLRCRLASNSTSSSAYIRTTTAADGVKSYFVYHRCHLLHRIPNPRRGTVTLHSGVAAEAVAVGDWPALQPPTLPYSSAAPHLDRHLWQQTTAGSRINPKSQPYRAPLRRCIRTVSTNELTNEPINEMVDKHQQ